VLRWLVISSQPGCEMVMRSQLTPQVEQEQPSQAPEQEQEEQLLFFAMLDLDM
jgi:hypothetical protein